MNICCGSSDGPVDVIVIGSGAPGLTAALSALDAGATVTVIEKSELLGGTSALSGGMVWIPANDLARAAGLEDSPEAALTYLQAVTKGRATPGLLEAHIGRGQELLDFVQQASGLRFRLIGSFPDYYPEFPGGRAGGRSIEPEPYDLNALGDVRRYLRDDPRPPFTQREYFEEWRTYSNFPWGELERRRAAGFVTRGTALVAPLVKAVADRGGTIVSGIRAARLIVAHGRTTGVQTDHGTFLARCAVVLASGGFEWNDQLCERFLSGPVTSRCSLPTNVGDGLKMAMSAGADLANTNEAWWGVHSAVPGVEAEGRALGTIVTVERSLPGAIVVNRRGERFTNESGSYYTFGKVLAAFDATTYGYRNLPAYLVVDRDYLSRYGLLGVSDPASLPDWILTGETLARLADRLGVDPDGLAATVERFNGFARDGSDKDFHRGDSAYDQYFGDHSRPHANLGEIGDGPYFAVEIQSGAIGTKGGVVTDVDARALDPWGAPIDGLYAVGNVSAHPIAFGYVGAGATLGPAMTMARAAGIAAASTGRAPH